MLKLLSCLIFVTIVRSTIIKVSLSSANECNDNVCPSIRKALDIFTEGDTILLSDGTYTGYNNTNIVIDNFIGSIQSENGPQRTIIDMQRSSFSFLFQCNSGVSCYTNIKGIQFTNGGVEETDQEKPHVIAVHNSSVYLENCIFMNNSLPALFIDQTELSDVVIESCKFEKNSQHIHINSLDCHLAVNNCKFKGNINSFDNGMAISIEFFNGVNSSISNCVFSDHRHGVNGVLYMDNVNNLNLQNITFEQNVGTSVSGVMMTNCSNISFTKCSFIENDGGSVVKDTNNINIMYEDIFFYQNQGNLIIDSPKNTVHTIKNCSFIENKPITMATLTLMKKYGNYGTSIIRIMDTQFTKNSPLNSNAGGISVEGQFNISIIGSMFTENIGSFGGSMTMINNGNSHNIYIENTGFLGNKDKSNTADIILFCNSTTLTMKNVAFQCSGGNGNLQPLRLVVGKDDPEVNLNIENSEIFSCLYTTVRDQMAVVGIPFEYRLNSNMFNLPSIQSIYFPISQENSTIQVTGDGTYSPINRSISWLPISSDETIVVTASLKYQTTSFDINSSKNSSNTEVTSLYMKPNSTFTIPLGLHNCTSFSTINQPKMNSKTIEWINIDNDNCEISGVVPNKNFLGIYSIDISLTNEETLLWDIYDSNWNISVIDQSQNFNELTPQLIRLFVDSGDNQLQTQLKLFVDSSMGSFIQNGDNLGNSINVYGNSEDLNEYLSSLSFLPTDLCGICQYQVVLDDSNGPIISNYVTVTVFATPYEAAKDSSSSLTNMDKGIIAVSVLGGLIVIALIIVVISFFFKRNKRYRKQQEIDTNIEMNLSI